MTLAQDKFLQVGTGAVNRTVDDKLLETTSVMDFGAQGDGVTDDSSAIQAAIDSGAKRVTFGDSANTYRIDSRLVLLAVNSDLILDFNGASLLPNGASTYNAIYIPAVGDGDLGVAGASNVTINNIVTDGSSAAVASAIGIKSYDADGLYINGQRHDNWSLSGCVVYGLASNTVRAIIRNTVGTGNTNHLIATSTVNEEASNIIIDGVIAWSTNMAVDVSTGSATVSNVYSWSNTAGAMKTSGNDESHIVISNINSYGDGQGFYTNGTYRLLEMDNVNVIDSTSHGVQLAHAGTVLLGNIHIENPAGQGFYQSGAAKTQASNITVNSGNERSFLISAGDFQCSNIKSNEADREAVEITTTGYVQIDNILSIDDCVAGTDNASVALSPSTSGLYSIGSITSVDTRGGSATVTIGLSVNGNCTDVYVGNIQVSGVTTAISDSGTDTTYLNADGRTQIGVDRAGFYGTAPVAQQTGVAISAAGIHTALVNLGLITA